MKIILAAATALSTTALAGYYDYTFYIQGLTIHKYNNTNISNVTFTISEANGIVDDKCSPHDQWTGKPPDNFKTDYLYNCYAPADDITSVTYSFRYVPSNTTDAGQLYLYEEINHKVRVGGSTRVNPPCSAKSNTTQLKVCTQSPDTFYKIFVQEGVE